MRSVEKTTHHDRDTAVLRADKYGFLTTNVGPIERKISTVIGGSLIGLGLYRRTLGSGLVAGLIGMPLLLRGALGHCALYQALGINTAGASGSTTRPRVLRGLNVVKSCVVDAPPEQCYAFWLDFERFPEFMEHLESVTVTGEKTSHWVARGPLGRTVEWDAEIVKTEEDRLIEWRSLDGSDVLHAGSVRFEPVARGKCKVTVTLRWSPPAGIAGFVLGKLSGEEPARQIEDDLCRFQQIIERGVTEEPEESP